MTTDKEAFEIYENPENRAPAGEGRKLPEQPLSSHVPIRFAPDTVAMVKYFAAADGLTVSSWIRREIERAIIRRLPRPRTGFQFFVDNSISNALWNPLGSPTSNSLPRVGTDADLNSEVSCTA